MLQNQFNQLAADFLAYCQSSEISPEELGQPPLFFNAPPVRKLLAFGADHNEFLQPIVKQLGKLGQMAVYRGSLAGYLIGLYGESEISEAQTDRVLGEFYLQMLALNQEYLLAACRLLNADPAVLQNSQEEAGEALIDQIRQLAPDEVAAGRPELAAAWQGFDPLSFGMMSRLAHSRAVRDRLRASDWHQQGKLIPLCWLLANFHEAVGFIPYMLTLVERETALVIAPESRRGVEVALEQIDNNNVFFTLLQFALYHKNLLYALNAAPFHYRPEVEKIARHEPVEDSEWPDPLSEQGCLGYYTYPAWRDGEYDEMQPVWGEGNFYEIPKLNGRFVILVTAPRIQRSWGSAYVASTHSGLRPRVEVLRELSAEEVELCLEMIRRANAAGN